MGIDYFLILHYLKEVAHQAPPASPDELVHEDIAGDDVSTAKEPDRRPKREVDREGRRRRRGQRDADHGRRTHHKGLPPAHSIGQGSQEEGAQHDAKHEGAVGHGREGGPLAHEAPFRHDGGLCLQGQSFNEKKIFLCNRSENCLASTPGNSNGLQLSVVAAGPPPHSLWYSVSWSAARQVNGTV